VNNCRIKKEKSMSKTYQEICAQYDALKKTDLYFEEKKESLISFFENNKFEKIIFVGCGSSFALAEGMAVSFTLHLGIQALAVSGGEMMLHQSSYKEIVENSLVVCISRSGRTSEILHAIEAMRKLNISFKVMSFICNDNTELSKTSDLSFEMPWGYDESVCQTRCVTLLYLCGALTIAYVKKDMALLESLRLSIRRGPDYLNRYEEKFQEIAKLEWNHAVLLSDCEISGIGREGALVFKEICQINSNDYHLLDSRHGPMVMIRTDTLVIIAVKDEKNKFVLDLIEDIKKKGAQIVVYSDIPCDVAGIENITFGERLEHMARGIPFILISQMIAYYKSFVTGANPDCPQGLEPWIQL